MARLKKNTSQRVETWEMYKLGFGPTAIHRALKVRFDAGGYGDFEDIVHLNTVKNWLREFRESDKGLDDRFEWHRMDEYGLPWDASSFLMTMWSWARESGPFAYKNEDFHFPFPSVREVKWWWRIHLVEASLTHKWVWTITQWFVARELLHDLLGKPIEMEDLEAYLAYKPWNKENLAVYRDAVSHGRVPEIKATPGWSNDGEWLWDFPVDETTEYTQLPRALAFGITSNPNSLFPDLDDSEQEDEQ